MSVFIKNVVAVAAYSQLANQSQAKCQQWNWVPFPLRAQPHLHRALYPPVVHFDFRFAHVRMSVWTRTVPVAFPGKFEHRNEDSLWLPQRSSVALRCGRLLKLLLVKKSHLFRLRVQPCLCWQDGGTQVTWPVVFHRVATESGCTHYRRRNDNHYRCQQCRLNKGLTLCTEGSPCEVCKDWLPEAWQAQEKANEQKRRRKAAKAAKKPHVKKKEELRINR